MSRWIKRELIQPKYMVTPGFAHWTEDEKANRECTRKVLIDPVDSGEHLFIVLSTPHGQEALTGAQQKALIHALEALDPEDRGVCTVPMGAYFELGEDSWELLVRKLDARNWWGLHTRELLRAEQEWRNAPQDKPLELGDVEPRNGKVSQLAKAGRR